MPASISSNCSNSVIYWFLLASEPWTSVAPMLPAPPPKLLLPCILKEFSSPKGMG